MISILRRRRMPSGTPTPIPILTPLCDDVEIGEVEVKEVELSEAELSEAELSEAQLSAVELDEAEGP